MTRRERFRYWLAGLIWPGLLEANAKIEGLQGRLAFTHKRMQEMYWEEKAKEMALARIAGLQEALEEACNVMYGSGSSQDSVRKFAEEAGISWTPENYERWCSNLRKGSVT